MGYIVYQHTHIIKFFLNTNIPESFKDLIPSFLGQYRTHKPTNS